MTDEATQDQEPAVDTDVAPEQPAAEPERAAPSQKDEIDRLNREQAEYRQMISGLAASLEHTTAQQRTPATGATSDRRKG